MSRRELILVALAACAAEPATEVERVESFDLPSDGPQAVDLLFVIDDSPAMAAHRDAILASTQMFADSIESARIPSLHIGVTTADPADAGTLHRDPLVSLPYLEELLYADGTGTRNYAQSRADALGAVLDVGTSGSSTITPLEATVQALQRSEDGFARPEAWLYLVILASADDASPQTIDAYASELTQRRADPHAAFVAVAYPRPASRFDAFLDALSVERMYVPSDQAAYGAALEPISWVRASPPTQPCMREPLDVDPTTPGAQYDCAISRVDLGREGEVETLVPACPSETQACWVLGPGVCDPGLVAVGLVPPGRPGPSFDREPHLRGECVVGN